MDPWKTHQERIAVINLSADEGMGTIVTDMGRE